MALFNRPVEERFKHDCPDCIYHGSEVIRVGKYTDWYFCPKSDKGSVIARRSSEPSDYSSAPIFLVYSDMVRQALEFGILEATHVPPVDKEQL